MIISGGSRSNGGFFARHLTNDYDGNDRAELKEMRGVTVDTVDEFFRETAAVASGTRCKNFFYHANLNPKGHEHLTPEQWTEAIDTLEKNLGLEGQPRFVMEHEKDGRTHRHVIWSRIDVDSMRAISDSQTAKIHERTSRELEIRFGLERGHSVLEPGAGERERNLPAWETFRGQKTGIDPRVMKTELTELVRSSDNAQAFVAALEDRGYQLARGDRRDFVILDHAGDDHSLARRVSMGAADLREYMQGIDRSALPSVEEARTGQREKFTRDGVFDRVAAAEAWREGLSPLAATKEQERRLDSDQFVEMKQRERPLTAIERAVDQAVFPRWQTGLTLRQELDSQGIDIARATAADMPGFREEHKMRMADETKNLQPLRVKEGDLFAVTREGNIHSLNPTKIDFAQVEKRLAVEGIWIPSVGVASDMRAQEAEARAAARQERMADQSVAIDREAAPAAEGSRAEGPSANAGIKLIDGVAQVFAKVADIAADILSFGMTASKAEPRPDNSFQADMEMRERTAQAITNMRESMDRGEGINVEDIRNLSPHHLSNLAARGDDALRDLIRREEEREPTHDWER